MTVSEGKKNEKLEVMRHSAAHVMAEAVQSIFHDARFGIGPAIENGFYYDFDLPRSLTPDDLPLIAARMKEIIASDVPFIHQEVTKEEARRLFAAQPYKLELIDEIPDEKVSLYQQGSFLDLCRGPQVSSTGKIKAFELLSIAGAYWRGDEHRPMLQRIYGVAFDSEKDLAEHIEHLEEAKRRDHRKLGRELEIFIFDNEVGPGLPLWLPNGGVIIEEIEKLAKEMELKYGYVRVKTPHLAKEELFRRSGHLPYYAETMYPPMEVEGVRYYLKPMNCPMHHKIFASKLRSYRDLPLRIAEYGTCYRYEKSGELLGLMRVRSMQMNDSHIYCSEGQFEKEFAGVVFLYLEYFKIFDIKEYYMRLSTHHPGGLGKKYVNNPALWLKTEDMVRKAMDHNNIPYREVADEAAFYGPKIDVQVKSAIGQEFTLATNQVDFAQAESFDLKFTNEQGLEERPLIIHRAPLGTHERLIGFLLEHYGGAFPVWLAPVQVVIIPVADRHLDYAYKVEAELAGAGIRVKVDARSERINLKIRQAQLDKIPYMVVLGDKEVEAGTISVRLRSGEQRSAQSLDNFKEATMMAIIKKLNELE
ncbi:MAG: threonine--tRNA ligase [Dehalococcoidales bacterium]|nr:threonine--tRNA ligase [Dehalococcoidales bacterium]MDZ4230727.1 threonine--tRNA ligase [Dehalococcoidales bacterium]